MNKQNMIYTCSGILFSLKKERNSVTCYNMNDSWGHYTQWKKPVSPRHFLMLHQWVPTVVKSPDIEIRMVVSRNWGDGSHLMDLEFQQIRVPEGDKEVATWQRACAEGYWDVHFKEKNGNLCVCTCHHDKKETHKGRVLWDKLQSLLLWVVSGSQWNLSALFSTTHSKLPQ